MNRKSRFNPHLSSLRIALLTATAAFAVNASAAAAAPSIQQLIEQYGPKLALVGPVTKITPDGVPAEVIGQEVHLSAAAGIHPEAVNVGDMVAVIGKVTNTSTVTADAIGKLSSDFVDGATPVLVTGVIAHLESSIGKATVGHLSVDYSATLHDTSRFPMNGHPAQFTGTMYRTQKLMVAEQVVTQSTTAATVATEIKAAGHDALSPLNKPSPEGQQQIAASAKVGSMGSGAANRVGSMGSGMANQVGSMGSGRPAPSLKVGSMGSGITNSVGSMGSGVSAHVGSMGSGSPSVSAKVGSMGSGLTSSVGSMGSGFNGRVGSMGSGSPTITAKVGSMGSGVTNQVGSMGSGVSAHVGSMGSGSPTISSKVGSMGSGSPAATSKVGSMGSGITASVGSMGSGSPSQKTQNQSTK
jgi:hypothetical protein